MFDALKTTIRTYIIAQLAQMVANDIVNTGLTAADEAAIDAIVNA